MFRFKLLNETKKLNILCLGAHSDDIEIGCGGTILRLINELDVLKFCWVVFSGNSKRANEAQKSAAVFLKDVQSKTISVRNYQESYFPFIGDKIKNYFEKLKTEFSPDVIFTHYMNDAHQDHRLISNLTWNTFRDHLILEYEIPKYDGDLVTPNFYVYLDKTTVQRKIKFICDNFNSQKERSWFDEETFRSILRIRGLESNSPSKYAEAFHCRKLVL